MDTNTAQPLPRIDSRYTTHACPTCGTVHLPPSQDTIDHAGHRLGDMQIENGDPVRWCFDCETFTPAA